MSAVAKLLEHIPDSINSKRVQRAHILNAHKVGVHVRTPRIDYEYPGTSVIAGTTQIYVKLMDWKGKWSKEQQVWDFQVYVWYDIWVSEEERQDYALVIFKTYWGSYGEMMDFVFVGPQAALSEYHREWSD